MSIEAVPDARRPQPTTNPAHTHIQVVLTTGSHLLVPIHIDDAAKAVRQWSDGSQVISVRPSDGSAFHFNAAVVVYMRQVFYDVAERMLAEQQKLDELKIAEANAQRAEAQRVREYNDEIRSLQLKTAKTQAARAGAIVG